MAEIAGLALLDASLNALTDAAANFIREPNIAVAVDRSGILYSPLAGGATIWEMLAETVIGALVEKLLNGEPDATVDLAAVARVVEDTYAEAHNAHLDAQEAWNEAAGVKTDLAAHDANLATGLVNLRERLTNLDTAIANLTLSGGGLTTQEHDQLMALVTYDTDQVASAVWGYNIPAPNMRDDNIGPMAETLVANIHEMTQYQLGYDGIPIPDRPFWRWIGFSPLADTFWLGAWTNIASTDWIPQLDVSTIQSGDTLIAWLRREHPTFSFWLGGPGDWPGGGQVLLSPPPNTGDVYARCTLDDAMVRACWPVNVTTQTLEVTTQVVDVTTQVVEVTQQTVDVSVRPIWPGLASVTLGPVLELADDLVIVGPMDGLLFTITGHPVQPQKYMFGTVASWSRVGAVIFGSDRGDYERSQTFSLDGQVMTPQTMTSAASAIIRLNPGWSGTVRRWSRA